MKLPNWLKQLYWDWQWTKALPMNPQLFINLLEEMDHQRGSNTWVTVSVNKDGTFKIHTTPK